MNRLNFSLPEFTRIIWSSTKARATWKPRIDAINNVWPEIERATVSTQMRPGGLQSIAPENLLTFQANCFNAHMQYAIVGREGTSPVYGNASQPVQDDKPWHYRVYFGTDPKTFLQEWAEGNQLRIGDFLGYPRCCSEFFQSCWVNDGWRDLTYPMMRNSQNNGPYTCNILLRHIGVRPVFHLPCSFNCDSTGHIGEEIIECACQMGFDIEMSWLKNILSWPIRWSSMHGVAIITTPVVKIITSSDALEGRVDLDRPGNSYPEEGASGNEFPFSQVPMSLLEGIRDTWTDNGFGSFSAMRKAHGLVLRTISTIYLDSGRIIDLGCGNGILLERIHKEHPHLIPYGVEYESGAYSRARERIGEEIWFYDLYDTDKYLQENFQIAIISLNRFKEIDEEKSEIFLKHLRNHVNFLVVYSYEDWKPDLDNLLSHHFHMVGVETNEDSEVRIFRPRS